MYTLVGSPRSRTMRVAWALEEIGAPYEWRPAPPRSEAILALNPSGKVPALIVDGRVLVDSVAIVQFLADRHGAMTHPAGTIERGEQDSFTQFVVDEVDGALWLAAKHSFVLPEELRVPAVKAAARHEFGRAMETLAARLGDRPFLTGDRFTVPDLILGHCAGWAERAKFTLPGGPVGACLERVRERPALARALEAAAGL
jgi:glutathione S-transferase